MQIKTKCPTAGTVRACHGMFWGGNPNPLKKGVFLYEQDNNTSIRPACQTVFSPLFGGADHRNLIHPKKVIHG